MRNQGTTFPGVMASFALACGGVGPGQTQGRLTAGADAQRHGIAAYQLDGEQVTLFGADQAPRGTLRLRAPSSDSRTIRLDMADKSYFENELTRPIADGTFVVTADGDNALTAIENDDAMAPFFAAAQIAFVRGSYVVDAQLRTSDTTTCTSNPVAACAWPACIEFVPCWEESDSNGTHTTRDCACRPVSCAWDQLDVVERRKDCLNGGSCTMISYFLYCTDGP